MAKKIILFLSPYREGASEDVYEYPDENKVTGKKVTGQQSSDAPVEYLMNLYSDISEIICIVSEEAREKALPYFKDRIKKKAPDVIVSDIPFHGEEAQQFIENSIAAIFKRVQEKDEILLETTGGFRNAVMYLLLISRALSYAGINTVGAVYSNFQPKKKIESLSHLIGMFDLIGGMQELSSFGAIQTLRAYYEKNHVVDPKINGLFQSVEELMEAIVLCRTGLIDKKMQKLDQAMEEAKSCSDVMLCQLLPAFGRKFGTELNILSLIAWCVNSGMIQQALTIYTERIPAYIMTKMDYLKIGDTVAAPPKKEYEDANVVLFMRGFLELSQNLVDAKKVNLVQAFRNYVKKNGNQIIRSNGIIFVPPDGVKKAVENMQILFHLAYPSEGNGFSKQWVRKLPKGKEALKGIEEWMNTCPPHTMTGMLNKFSAAPDTVICQLLEKPVPKLSDDKRKNPYVLTLENLEKLLPGSGYEVTCSIKKIKQITNDYLYIKMLRNLANHANHEENKEQESLLEYLVQNGYKPIKKVGLKEIGTIILNSLEHLKNKEI